MKNNNNTRRRFFGLALGAGAMAAFGLSKAQQKKSITHYIGPDGKLYEVDPSKVKKVAMCAPESKKSLRKWLDRHLKKS